MYRLCLCLLILLLLPAPALAAGKNVVLMVVDDQGLDAGCFGNRVVRTPHLDALAADATRFSHAFCTTASCSPSRSVILTGLHNHANGQYGLAHAEHNFHSFDSVRGLPLLLKAAGYRTCSIGKLHVLPETAYHFDQYLNDGILGGRHSVQMAENARKFIAQQDDRPFFLYFCPTDPHRAAKGFANDRDYPGIEPVRYDPDEIEVPAYLPDRPEVRQELAEYYAAISRVDQGLGRLVEVLKETGHYDDTLLIYLSDNGAPFPGAKTTLYEPGTRLPLVVRDPSQPRQGNVCEALVSWTDITPTILDYAGADGPKYRLHGRSLLPILDQASPAGWDEITCSHSFHEITMYYPMRALRTRKHKYISNLAYELPFPFASDLWGSATWQGIRRHPDEPMGRRQVADFLHRPSEELYDLETDPDELHNLAGEPQHAATLNELRGKLRKWQRETNDPWTILYREQDPSYNR